MSEDTVEVVEADSFIKKGVQTYLRKEHNSERGHDFESHGVPKEEVKKMCPVCEGDSNE